MPRNRNFAAAGQLSVLGAISSAPLSFSGLTRCYIAPSNARRTDQGPVFRREISMSFAAKLEILFVYAALAFVGAIVLGMF